MEESLGDVTNPVSKDVGIQVKTSSFISLQHKVVTMSTSTQTPNLETDDCYEATILRGGRLKVAEKAKVSVSVRFYLNMMERQRQGNSLSERFKRMTSGEPDNFSDELQPVSLVVKQSDNVKTTPKTAKVLPTVGGKPVTAALQEQKSQKQMAEATHSTNSKPQDLAEANAKGSVPNDADEAIANKVQAGELKESANCRKRPKSDDECIPKVKSLRKEVDNRVKGNFEAILVNGVKVVDSNELSSQPTALDNDRNIIPSKRKLKKSVSGKSEQNSVSKKVRLDTINNKDSRQTQVSTNSASVKENVAELLTEVETPVESTNVRPIQESEKASNQIKLHENHVDCTKPSYPQTNVAKMPPDTAKNLQKSQNKATPLSKRNPSQQKKAKINVPEKSMDTTEIIKITESKSVTEKKASKASETEPSPQNSIQQQSKSTHQISCSNVKVLGSTDIKAKYPEASQSKPSINKLDSWKPRIDAVNPESNSKIGTVKSSPSMSSILPSPSKIANAECLGKTHEKLPQAVDKKGESSQKSVVDHRSHAKGNPTLLSLVDTKPNRSVTSNPVSPSNKIANTKCPGKSNVKLPQKDKKSESPKKSMAEHSNHAKANPTLPSPSDTKPNGSVAGNPISSPSKRGRTPTHSSQDVSSSSKHTQKNTSGSKSGSGDHTTHQLSTSQTNQQEVQFFDDMYKIESPSDVKHSNTKNVKTGTVENSTKVRDNNVVRKPATLRQPDTIERIKTISSTRPVHVVRDSYGSENECGIESLEHRYSSPMASDRSSTTDSLEAGELPRDRSNSWHQPEATRKQQSANQTELYKSPLSYSNEDITSDYIGAPIVRTNVAMKPRPTFGNNFKQSHLNHMEGISEQHPRAMQNRQIDSWADLPAIEYYIDQFIKVLRLNKLYLCFPNGNFMSLFDIREYMASQVNLPVYIATANGRLLPVQDVVKLCTQTEVELSGGNMQLICHRLQIKEEEWHYWHSLYR